MNAKTTRLVLIAILVLYLALGLVYSVAVPIFEKPDEIFHFFVVQHLLEERSLPVQGGEGAEWWEQEGSQPPLYYLLAALTTSWVDTGDARELVWLNPQRNMGNPGDPGNKNYMVHTERESWPYRGATLAVHIGRWLSLLFGAGSVLATYALGRELFPQKRFLVLGAAGIVAFIPQFLFISSAVSNDSLITLLSTLALWQLARLVNRPAQQGLSSYVLLGITLGLAALTKLSGAALLGLSALVLVWLAWRQRDLRILLKGGLIAGGLAAAIAGWWYLRNLRLYGDLTGLELMLDALGGRRAPFVLTWESLRDELVGLRASFWGLYGWFGILMPDWVYLTLDAFTLLGVLGLLRWFWNSRLEARRSMILLLLWLGIVCISLARWTLMIAASQGRLLFPTLPGIALALVVGWSHLTPSKPNRWLPLAVTAGLLALSATVPTWIIAPAYVRPPLIADESALPADLLRLELTFGEQVRLIGCTSDPGCLYPGETLGVTCYWQLLEPVEADYFFFYHLLGRGTEPVGKEHGYPGSGTFPTSLWPGEAIVADSARVRVEPGADVPVLGRLAVGVFDPQENLPLIARTPAGDPRELVVAGEVKIGAPEDQYISIPNPLSYSVGDLALLAGYQVEVEKAIQVTLYWTPTASPPEDYTVFVHLLDARGELAGGGDGPPVGGDYPTSYWEPGETIVDVHTISIQDGDHRGPFQLAVGLYRPADETRLPAWDSAGIPQPADRVILPFTLDALP